MRRNRLNRLHGDIPPSDWREPICCKVGTIPATIYLFRHYSLRLNQKVQFRYYNNRDWLWGLVIREAPLLIGK